MRATTSETARKWGLRVHIFSYVIGNLAQIVTWWLFTPDHFFWPLWSILGWGVGLFFHGWAVRSPVNVQPKG
ncbi:2TM domain-containing protein [Micromonospora sp. NPDC048935]|uniref:2TM domain-containing protein n=1 Tax=Micromonospora sp. NPDC048935 TaxID=3364262 RepID=UPI003715471B